MKKIVILIAAVLILLGCGKSKDIKVTGIINNAGNDSVFLVEMSNNGWLGIDSALLKKDGRFELNFSSDIPKFYALYNERNSFITLILKPGDKVFITADATNLFTNYEVDGSDESQRIKDLTLFINQKVDIVDSLSAVFRDNMNKENFLSLKTQLDSIYNKIKIETQQHIRKFIKDNPAKLSSLLALYQQIAPREAILNWEEDNDLYILVDSLLFKEFPNSDAVIQLHGQLEEYRNHLKMMNSKVSLNIGDTVPNFILPDATGKEYSLSDFKGKYVLLDFWASWCAPCREENPILVKIYEKYKIKNFEIVQVSLDRDRDSWLKAINDFKLSWLNLSDLQYWDSPVAKLYSIQSIPTNFLLNPQGIIIARDLRGEMIEPTLQRLLK